MDIKIQEQEEKIQALENKLAAREAELAVQETIQAANEAKKNGGRDWNKNKKTEITLPMKPSKSENVPQKTHSIDRMQAAETARKKAAHDAARK